MRKFKLRYFVTLYIIIGLLIAGSVLFKESFSYAITLPEDLLWFLLTFLLWPLALVDFLEGLLSSILPILVVIPLIFAVVMDLRKKKFVWIQKALVAIGAIVVLNFTSKIVSSSIGILFRVLFLPK